MVRVIRYVSQVKKTMDETGHCYLSGINCTPELAQKSFMATKNLYRKAGGTFFYQYVQSFSPKEEVTPGEAHQIAQELAERFFPGCEVLVATHMDAEHLHSHLIVNSVHPDTGKKLHFTPNTLEQMRKVSDQICVEHGLTTLKPYQQNRHTQGLRTGESRVANRGDSWKFQLIITIEKATKRTGTREEFLREMNQQGYQVRWEEGRKSITYTTPTGKKCRDDKLHELKFRKEQMEHEFRIRQRAAQQFARRPEAETENIPGHTDLDKPADQHPLHHAVQTVERLEQVLRRTLALQENIRSDLDSLATKKNLEPLATADLLARWLNRTAEFHQGMREDLKKVQRGIHEENRQAGKQRDEFMRQLSEQAREFRGDGSKLMNTFQRWAVRTILCSATVSEVISILICRLLT